MKRLYVTMKEGFPLEYIVSKTVIAASIETEGCAFTISYYSFFLG